MKRRNFLKDSAVSTMGIFISTKINMNATTPVYGHNNMQYTLDTKWGTLNADQTPVNDCHEMIQDGKGRIVLLTNETKNNIIVYNKSGKLLESWGHDFPGAHGLSVQHDGEGDAHFDNAHGICVDTRNGKPSLLITDRTRNAFKRFSMDGKLLEVIHLPGACMCRPVIKGDYLYAAVLRSPNLDTEHTGFITILDKQNKVVSNLGGSKPAYANGVLQPMSQTDKILNHPHDVCVDDDGNIYVAQWASGKVYPYKFSKV